MLDKIKSTGYKYSTRGAITVAVCDAVIPPKKYDYVAESDKLVEKIQTKYRRGFLTADERYNEVIKLWNETAEKVANALKDNLDDYNPIYMMADSGARGSMNQIRQLAGMRGLIANTSGRAIEIPIRSNYREGLNVLEYFISSRGARKGLADTALRTADSGYLTRRLVDVSQEVIIRDDDCRSDSGLYVTDIYDKSLDLFKQRDADIIAELTALNGKEPTVEERVAALKEKYTDKPIEALDERLVGRFLINDCVDNATGEVVVSANDIITDDMAAKIIRTEMHNQNTPYPSIGIRSILGCKSRHGVCRKCYGSNLANGLPVTVGEAVGIIAAQSIGEPGTQLTMRNFHTGGVADADDITQGLPRVEELFEARKPKRAAILSEIAGKVSFQDVKRNHEIVVTSDDLDNPDTRSYTVPFGYRVRVNEGDYVEKGENLTEGALNPHDLLAIMGPDAVQDYIIKEVQSTYRSQGVEINDKHIEVIVHQMMRQYRITDAGDTDLIVGTNVERGSFYEANYQIDCRKEAGEEGLRYAEFEPTLLGITKASLATDSFLSAASFQETTRVLTDAAVKGKIDRLVGLKENVIIGKLIPAGTGMKCFQKSDEPEVAAEVEAVEEVETTEETFVTAE